MHKIQVLLLQSLLGEQNIGKDSDAGRDWGQEKGTTEDERAGWHHRLTSLDVSLSELRVLVMDREVWHAAIQGIARSWTRLSDLACLQLPCHFTCKCQILDSWAWLIFLHGVI